MGTFDYSRRVATALRLIEKFGQAASIVRTVTTPGGNAWDPSVTTSTTYACNLVVSDYLDGQIDGTVIQSGDRKVMIAASGLAVTPSTATDKLTIGSETWTLVSVKPLAPGGTPIVYTVQVRK